MLRLIGSEAWLQAELARVLVLVPNEGIATLRGERLHEVDGRSERVRTRLGEEVTTLVVATTVAFDASALGAALGMVKGGGLVVWLDDGKLAPSNFGRHIARALD